MPSVDSRERYSSGSAIPWQRLTARRLRCRAAVAVGGGRVVGPWRSSRGAALLEAAEIHRGLRMTRGNARSASASGSHYPMNTA
jgi:hypothetical protein